MNEKRRRREKIYRQEFDSQSTNLAKEEPALGKLVEVYGILSTVRNPIEKQIRLKVRRLYTVGTNQEEYSTVSIRSKEETRKEVK